jgi:uncharacterized membrane protein
VKKNIRKILIGLGVVLIPCALVPTFMVALNKVIEGDYGNSGTNFFGQPLPPVISVLTIGAIFFLFPLYVFRKKQKRSSKKCTCCDH